MPVSVTFGPLALFALVASITPGPNNLLLMRSGARFGVRGSLWHLLGVQSGFVMLVLLAHLGIGAVLLAFPLALQVLRWGCFFYLLWLGWLILRDARQQVAAAGAHPAVAARPMNWLEAVMFQLVNPKAWMMALTTASAFYGGATPSHIDLLLATLLGISIGGPCMLVWTIWGAGIDHVLKRPQARRSFGYCMAALVVATAFWMLR